MLNFRFNFLSCWLFLINKKDFIFFLVIYIILCIKISLCDASESWQLNIQDPASYLLQGMLDFHNYIMILLIFIGIFVCFILKYCIEMFNSDVNLTPYNFAHLSTLEVVWTILPAFLLIVIAVPSFALLYSLDEILNTKFTLKVIGHQWYWSYEYPSDVELYNLTNKNGLSFDSYMIPTDSLTKGSFRLLEVDNRIVLPILENIKVLITSSDVIHCWAVPSLGVKLDAVPGRLSETSFVINRPGTFFGQCSEICGVNHGFMPIVIKAMEVDLYNSWFIKKLSS